MLFKTINECGEYSQCAFAQPNYHVCVWILAGLWSSQQSGHCKWPSRVTCEYVNMDESRINVLLYLGTASGRRFWASCGWGHLGVGLDIALHPQCWSHWRSCYSWPWFCVQELPRGKGSQWLWVAKGHHQSCCCNVLCPFLQVLDDQIVSSAK